jgi:DNA polymerase elongation subunit (family B)
MTELQVYSVSIEDRHPPALAVGYDREETLDDEFSEHARGPAIEVGRRGAVVYVFGRDAEARSVCVRVEGFKPCLYYEVRPGDEAEALRSELEAEARRAVRDPGAVQGVSVRRARFAHFYDYEPDPASPSGRRAHDYWIARYPTLAAWRAACRLRQLDDDEREDEGALKAAALERIQGLRTAHEWFVDPTTRFLHDAGITPGGWVRVPGAQTVEQRVSTCDLELGAALDGFVALPERTLDAPYTVLYYDIETLGLDPHTASAIQVSLVFVRGGVVDKHLVALGSVAPIEGVTVHGCVSEADLLRVTRREVVRGDPDFVVAYNGVNFDNNFLAVRAQTLGVDVFWYLSRFALRKSRLRELKLNSSGMGDNTLRYFDMPGRANFDWFQKLKLEHTSEPSYKLAHFAQKFCGDDKEDMHYKEIPVLQAGTAQDRARLGSYCVHDSLLLHRLDEALTLVVGIIQFAQVFRILPEWVHFRGQQVRYVAQLLRTVRACEAVEMLMQLPTRGLSGEGVTSYGGATVNDPKKGFYKQPVVTLDWMSLYPSLMLAHNTCPSTLVRDPALFEHDGVVAHRVSDEMTTRFATKHKGVLPRILEELLDERKLAKKRMKAHAAAAKDAGKSDAERAREAALVKVMNGRQLALKVSANSVYGANGATVAGKYYCLAVSATVTYEGRRAMEIKKEILPQRFPGIDVIYGDSVAAATPLLLRDAATHAVSVASCASLAAHCLTWTPTADGKELGRFARATEAWSDAGWTPVAAVFRHRAPGKRLFRVSTRTGVVEVTEDHSLVRADGTPLPPRACVVDGTELLHAWPAVGALPVVRECDDALPPEAARALGAALSAGTVDDPSLAARLSTALHASRVAKAAVVAGSGVLAAGGLRVADGAAALALFALLRDLGHARAFVAAVDGRCAHVVGVDGGAPFPPPGVVRCVECVGALGAGDYVYDLTTASHHFHAGVGDLIVHNTDSVMVTFAGVTDVQETLSLGEEAATFVTEEFARRGYPSMVLEFEKTYWPYLLFKKKRYIGLKYEPGDGAMVCKGIDAAGVETERKDTLPFLKDIYYDVRDALILKIDPQLALARLDAHLQTLVDDKVPIERMTMSKSLSATYQKEELVVQACVNRRRLEREPGSEMAPGERVEYVILEGHPKAKACELAECAHHAKAHRLPLNRMYYLEHMIHKPMKSLFEIVEGADVGPVFARAKAALDRARLGVGEGMRAFFTTGAASAPASAPATRTHVPRPPAPRPKAKRPKAT